MYKLKFTEAADQAIDQLEAGGQATRAKHKKVLKTLRLLQDNPRHPGLASHQYETFPGYTDEKVWESYVENRTSSAWRIFWMYGPDEKVGDEPVPVITILAITPHP